MTGDENYWLTYEEAAVKLGVDADSVKRRAQRQRWPRRQGNDPRDRRVRVAIPADVLPREDASPDTAPEPLAALMERLTERAIAAEARAAAAEATVAAQAAELRRWIRRAPTKHPAVVIRRLDRMAKGGRT